MQPTIFPLSGVNEQRAEWPSLIDRPGGDNEAHDFVLSRRGAPVRCVASQLCWTCTPRPWAASITVTALAPRCVAQARCSATLRRIPALRLHQSLRTLERRHRQADHHSEPKYYRPPSLTKRCFVQVRSFGTIGLRAGQNSALPSQSGALLVFVHFMNGRQHPDHRRWHPDQVQAQSRLRRQGAQCRPAQIGYHAVREPDLHPVVGTHGGRRRHAASGRAEGDDDVV